MKIKNTTIIITVLLLVLSVFTLAGCGAQKRVLEGAASEDVKLKQQVNEQNTLTTLQYNAMELGVGELRTNKIVIKNNYDVTTKFKISYSDSAEGWTVVEIPAQGIEVVDFSVKATKIAGEYTEEVKVMDELDNVYSSEKFKLTIT